MANASIRQRTAHGNGSLNRKTNGQTNGQKSSGGSTMNGGANRVLAGAVTKRLPSLAKQQPAYRHHRLDPDDPRLKLSMRAFYPVLDKMQRSRPSFPPPSQLQSWDSTSQSPSFSSLTSLTSQSSPSSHSSQPASPPSAEYLAFKSGPPGLPMLADLYDPGSPWGVQGIKYDPRSPRPASTAVPLSFASSSSSPQSSPSPPPPGWHHKLQLHHVASSTADLQEAANHGLAADIVNMFAMRRCDGNRTDKQAPVINYPEMRFVLANGNSTASAEPSQASSSSTPAARSHLFNLPPRAKATPKKAQPAKKTPVPAPAMSMFMSRCCPPEVPSIVHMCIDGHASDKGRDEATVLTSLGMLKRQFADKLRLLCPGHREKFLRMDASVLSATSFSVHPPAASAASQPLQPFPSYSSYQAPPCRPPPTLQSRPAASASAAAPPPPFPAATTAVRPIPRPARDDIYRHEMLREISSRFHPLGEEEEHTHGEVTSRVVYDLLNVAVHPQPVVDGRGDAYFLSGEEAYALLDRCSPREPVVTQNEQTFRWRPRTRPIEELFRRMENLDRKVSVQVPSRRCTDDSFESRDLTEVRRRFMHPSPPDDDPWNVLDLRSPLPAAVLPQFLTSENCQLLPRVRDEVLNPSRAERDTAPREQWNEWRDVLEWVLLSEGGHNTSPHTDSHGLATWITVQEGLFGFGWMSHPTAAERQQWMDDPQGFQGGRWCFTVLEPGQTVFFNSGTVHFVFRQRGQATLALGGHILQWSGIARWVEIVRAQMKNPHITNEDMEWSAPKYVRVVARLVAMRLEQGRDELGRIAAMGGEAAVQRLLQLFRDFDEEHVRPRLKAKSKKKRR